jgi:hypothetical protein
MIHQCPFLKQFSRMTIIIHNFHVFDYLFYTNIGTCIVLFVTKLFTIYKQIK